jgi:hypothetical protein
MILTPLKSDLAELLNSDYAVAICQAEGERLKSLVLLVRKAGWGVVVVETASGDHHVIAAAHQTHLGNLIGDTRRWNGEHRYRFSLKRADECVSRSPGDMVLSDGRVVEVRRAYTIASGFTHWALSSRETLPSGYMGV